MNEGTQNQNAPDSPSTATTAPVSYSYCSWHLGYSADTRVINVQEQGSGPGGVQFACLSCREKHNLVPYADQP
ncbi:hypothetical protein OG453_02650 [Streptomyces sp. NBC_01381]|uniref:hypothetical protein n=1 Tax=Streptomyces sp. NBC_01381 TaxID=2903845 RepID=UPI002257A0A9|nr:hypothetical protein [Streptomyces sp. NBC_01381]MCX4665583.1 hypothetical protein [Streptomyces sp. NBC_01381]